MALICKHYAQVAQKPGQKFCAPKNSENGKTAPGKARKRRTRVRFGCWRGWERLRTGENGWERLAIGQKDLVSPAGSVGPGRSPPGCRPPRHALRRAQPCLVAESLCALTKNREASIVLASLFLAGAEGLEPSARGFGVDVGKHTRERGKGRCHPILAASHKTGGAGLVLRPQKEGRGRLIPATSRFCTPPPRPAWRPGWA